MKSLEEAKQLILAQKEPNREPLPEDNAVYSRCGRPGDTVPACQGCASGGLNGKGDCPQLKCAAKKGLEKCQDCPKYIGECSPGVGYNCGIEPRSISAEDVTWAILPYVEDQYGN